MACGRCNIVDWQPNVISASRKHTERLKEPSRSTSATAHWTVVTINAAVWDRAITFMEVQVVEQVCDAQAAR